MGSPQENRSEKGWGLCCRDSISRADQTLQTAMRDLPPMVRLEAPRLHWGRTRQAGNAADGPSRTTRNKSPRCMRAQHKGSSPSNHSLRKATATTNDGTIDSLQHSSPDCVGPTSLTRPTGCRSSRSGRLGGMPEASFGTTLVDFVYRNSGQPARTARDDPPKSDLELLPSQGRSVCGLKLRSSENHPLRDGLVGKSRPLGSEPSKKSSRFCSIT
jgi:hypothetical protein